MTAADADLGLPAEPGVATPVREKEGPAFHLVVDETGMKTAVVRVPAIADSARRPAQTIRFVALNVPARGFRRYRVVAGETPAATACAAGGMKLNSPAVAVTIAPDGSGVARISDRATGIEWLAGDHEFTLGEVVYESIPGPFGREKLSHWGGIRRDAPLVRTRLRFGPPTPVTVTGGAGIRLSARELPGSLRALQLDIAVYDALPRVDLCYRLDKMPEAGAEALYVAFPLAGGRSALPDSTLTTRHSSFPEVWLDVPGAVMRPGLDQVPGTATDWHSIQHYFAVAAAEHTTVVASPDIPLVQVNGINTGRWQATLPSHNGLVMSWVMNNYWFTNFPAAQGGGFAWRYSLMAIPGGFDRDAAARFALAFRQPLVATLDAMC